MRKKKESLTVPTIVLKPDPVIDPVKRSGHGSDGLTRVDPGQPKKKNTIQHLIN
jgi:hypothetical protein